MIRKLVLGHLVFCLAASIANAQGTPAPAEARRPRSTIELLQVEFGPRVQREPAPDKAGVDFRIGRDNLAFQNLSGIWRTPGDCYAFSLTAKMFFEGARWKPTGDRNAGFSFEGLVRHFEGGGASRFDVEGYPGLFDMTDAPDLTEDRALTMMRGDGKDPSAGRPLETLKEREKMKYQTILFLNLVQNLVQPQAEMANGVRLALVSGLTRLGKSTEAGGEAMQEATRKFTLSSIDEIRTTIASGKVCPVSMMNLKELFGHVVLVYKYENTRDGIDLTVYDSNVQAGAERGESILRISRDASSITYHRKVGDRIEADGLYDGMSFFSEKKYLTLLVTRGLDRDQMKRVAHTVAFASEVNMFTDATNRMMSDLKDPAKTLRTIIRDFIVQIQGTHDRLGVSYIGTADRITEKSTVEELNKFLGRYAQVALRAINPHALPPGVRFEDPRLVLSPSDENRGDLEATILLSEGVPIPAFIRSMQTAGLLMNDRNLTGWSSAIQEKMGEVNLRASFGMGLQKVTVSTGGGAGPIPAIHMEGIVTELRWLHGVVGSLEPSNHASFVKDSPYRVEVGREVLQRWLDIAASRLKLYGTKEAEILRFKTGAGDIDLRMEDGKLALAPSARGTSGVISLRTNLRLMANGLEFGVTPLTVEFRVDHSPIGEREQVRLSGRVQGNLTLPGDIRNLAAGTALDLVNANSEALRKLINDQISDQLMENLLGFKLISFPTADRIDKLTVGTTRISAVTDWATLDVGSARERFLKLKIPVKLCQFHVQNDRLILAARGAAGRTGD